MSQEEAKQEIQQVLRRHAGDLDPDDLREIAGGLEQIADRWEKTEL